MHFLYPEVDRQNSFCILGEIVSTVFVAQGKKQYTLANLIHIAKTAMGSNISSNGILDMPNNERCCFFCFLHGVKILQSLDLALAVACYQAYIVIIILYSPSCSVCISEMLLKGPLPTEVWAASLYLYTL